jgi:hypothetical protein
MIIFDFLYNIVVPRITKERAVQRSNRLKKMTVGKNKPSPFFISFLVHFFVWHGSLPDAAFHPLR